MESTITRIFALAAIALALLASSSSAQDAYPTHPVRVIAASAAGGNPDVLARILSARLSEIFNNPFVVEDVPGVGGVIAAKHRRGATGWPHAGAKRFRLTRHQYRDES
jgi:tripartite-type tricarboxylate transporter receptor subunit TctC